MTPTKSELKHQYYHYFSAERTYIQVENHQLEFIQPIINQTNYLNYPREMKYDVWIGGNSTTNGEVHFEGVLIQ